ncbi:hypothetical protein BDA99DRAFT_569148 [Phascolomyces articulosus]|uniref:Uncharacterized protein n=1 Tax=Phascolomyces articulosus TaxID=60185 RepID=A0AAD5KIH3_9FUNG|nr:hypothetical protein BDA99DRAFT_569148 [Phascolomyces articulosus]
MYFISRIWTLLDRSFDSIMVQTRRDQTSISTTTPNNQNRSITGLAPVESNATAARPDLKLYQFGMEFGAAECGKADEAGIGKKEIVESITISECENIEATWTDKFKTIAKELNVTLTHTKNT